MYRKFSTAYLLYSLFMIMIQELHNITNNYVLLWDGEREQHLLTVMLNCISVRIEISPTLYLLLFMHF